METSFINSMAMGSPSGKISKRYKEKYLKQLRDSINRDLKEQREKDFIKLQNPHREIKIKRLQDNILELQRVYPKQAFSKRNNQVKDKISDYEKEISVLINNSK
mgnify:CR=1 FL=1